MKKIICVLLVVLLAALTACASKTAEPAVTAEPQTAAPAPEKTDAAEPAAQETPAAAEEPATEETEEAKQQEPIVYESEIASSYADEPAEEQGDMLLDESQERLTLLDDTNAEYAHITYYPDGSYNTYTMPGTYQLDGDTVVFDGQNGYDRYTFKLEGSKLTDTEYSYRNPAVAAVAGSYKNADYTLEIREDGTADLYNFRGERHSGYFYELSDGWEFSSYDETTGESVDYVIELNGDRFSMESFLHKRYSPFAGRYNMTGDLGAFVLTVDAEGNASADVMISGREVAANGYIYLDFEDQVINGCSLIAETGEQIDLQFGEQIGDSINYFGTLSILLAAG